MRRLQEGAVGKVGGGGACVAHGAHQKVWCLTYVSLLVLVHREVPYAQRQGECEDKQGDEHLTGGGFQRRALRKATLHSVSHPDGIEWPPRHGQRTTTCVSTAPCFPE